MQEDGIVPDTAEWKKARMGRLGIRVGASDSPTICNLSEYAYRAEFYDWIVEMGRAEKEDDTRNNAARGHLCEPVIRDNLYAKLLDPKYTVKQGHFYVSKEFPDYYACTTDVDVYDEKGNYVWSAEIKAPENITKVKARGPMRRAIQPRKTPEEEEKDLKGKVNISYYCQVQFQLWITGKPWVDLIVVPQMGLDGDPNFEGRGEVIPHDFSWKRIFPDPEFQARMKLQLLYFSSCLKLKKRPLNRLDEEEYPTPEINPRYIIDMIDLSFSVDEKKYPLNVNSILALDKFVRGFS